MIRGKRRRSGMTVIDLTGPQGNAFVLLGVASDLGRRMGWTKDEIDALRKKMTSGDYENLVKSLDEAFGDVLILER